MPPKGPDSIEADCEAAEQAFAAAQRLPVGPERIAALKRAGQMRFDAVRRKQAELELMERDNKNLRRGYPRPAIDEKGPS